MLPDVTFAWFPALPDMDSEVRFVASSSYYTTANPETMVPCLLSTCTFLWSFPGLSAPADYEIVGGDGINSTSTEVVFHTSGLVTVQFDTTDPDNYTCASSTDFNVKYSLPDWREIKY
jgi:hypothetical protein